MKENDKYSLHSMDNIKRAKVDKDYLGELIIANEGLIRFTINKYVGQPKLLLKEFSVEMDDLLQIGRIAFMNAIEGFDCDRGILFTSYVPTAIIRDIRHFLRDNGKLIKMPRSAYTLFSDILNYLSDVQYKEIDFEQVAEHLGESVEDVYKAWCFGSRAYHLDEAIAYGSHSSWVDRLIDRDVSIEDEIVEELYLEELLESVKCCLDDLEQDILNRKIEGDLQSEIAQECDCTQMKVSRTIKKVRKIINEKLEEL